MWISLDYTYNPSNLELANINLAWGSSDAIIIAIIILWMAIAIAYYIILPYINWYLMIIKEDKRKLSNKNRIRELILMKEVQNELEIEMKETLLNSWLNTTQHLHG